MPIVEAEFSVVVVFDNANSLGVEYQTYMAILVAVTIIITTSCVIVYNKKLYFYEECFKLIRSEK